MNYYDLFITYYYYHYLEKVIIIIIITIELLWFIHNLLSLLLLVIYLSIYYLFIYLSTCDKISHYRMSFKHWCKSSRSLELDAKRVPYHVHSATERTKCNICERVTVSHSTINMASIVRRALLATPTVYRNLARVPTISTTRLQSAQLKCTPVMSRNFCSADPKPKKDT